MSKGVGHWSCLVCVRFRWGAGVGHTRGFITSKMAAILTSKISGKCNFAKTSGYFLNWPP